MEREVEGSPFPTMMLANALGKQPIKSDEVRKKYPPEI